MECCMFETHQRSKSDFMVWSSWLLIAHYRLLTSYFCPPHFYCFRKKILSKVSLLFVLLLSCRHCWDEKRSELIKMLMCLLESPSVRSVSSAVSRVCSGGFVDFALGSASHATCSGCPICLISEGRWGCVQQTLLWGEERCSQMWSLEYSTENMLQSLLYFTGLNVKSKPSKTHTHPAQIATMCNVLTCS